MGPVTGQHGTCDTCSRDVHVEGRWVHSDGRTYRHQITPTSRGPSGGCRADLESLISAALAAAASEMRDDEPLPRGRFAVQGTKHVMAVLDRHGLIQPAQEA